MGVTPRVRAVVPTLGRSPLLGRCLAALRREGGDLVEIVVVAQDGSGPALPEGAHDRLVAIEANLGFAGGCNLGLEGAETELVATVNDDAVVQPGWLAALLAALERDRAVAAVQGVNLRLDRPELADGWGLGWKRNWQPVQLGKGRPAPPESEPPREVFGVSATAAIYRRDALLRAAPRAGQIFDGRLVSYYEDVDLACRLRAAGHLALVVPAARALHAGSTSGPHLGPERWRLVYSNHHLVLARFLGRGFWPRAPWFAALDAAHLARAVVRREFGRARAILEAWPRTLRLLPAFRRAGPPHLPAAERTRLRRAAREWQRG